MTHSYVWHDSFNHATWICVTRLIQSCDMNHSYVRHDAFICAPWHIHMCAMTHSYVRHDSFIHAPRRLIGYWKATKALSSSNSSAAYMRVLTHTRVYHDSFIDLPGRLVGYCEATKGNTSAAYMCVVTHTRVYHDSFIHISGRLVGYCEATKALNSSASNTSASAPTDTHTVTDTHTHAATDTRAALSSLIKRADDVKSVEHADTLARLEQDLAALNVWGLLCSMHRARLLKRVGVNKYWCRAFLRQRGEAGWKCRNTCTSRARVVRPQFRVFPSPKITESQDLLSGMQTHLHV